MMELAKECRHLDVFTHVSTCYVNCNQPDGPVQEEVYDQDMDVESKVARLMAMNP